MHMQEGTHKEMPLPAELIVDRAPGFLTEAGMFSDVRQREVVSSKEIKLINDEAKNPRDVGWFNGEGVIVFWNEGHVIVSI